MTKPEHGQDRIQREIEELLDKLDTFVPEERLASKIRNRSKRKEPTTPGALQRSLSERRTHFARQLIIGGIALLLIAFFFRGPLGSAASWLMIVGLVLAGAAFVLSLITGGTGRTVTGAAPSRNGGAGK